jgi:hypothetical protein
MYRIVLILLISTCSGCSLWQGMTARETVKPWERDILAQDGMQLPPDKMQSFLDDHIYFSKEASTGGNSVGGGGCGCN